MFLLLLLLPSIQSMYEPPWRSNSLAPISTARSSRTTAIRCSIAPCMELIRRVQGAGALWAINTGRSVELARVRSARFRISDPARLHSHERARRFPASQNGGDGWEPFGDWNERCAREHTRSFQFRAISPRRSGRFRQPENEGAPDLPRARPGRPRRRKRG